MPQSFGQKDYSDLDRLSGLLGRISQADLRQRLFVADQERQKQERAAVRDVYTSYTQAISGKPRQEQQMPGFVGPPAPPEELSPQEEQAETMKAMGRLSAIGGPEAKNAAQNIIDIRRGTVTAEERTMDRALRSRLFEEGLGQKREAETAKTSIEQQKVDVQKQRNEIVDTHNKAMDKLKAEGKNVLVWDASGKISVNPNAKPADIIKFLPTYINAITSGVMRQSFTEPTDTTGREAIGSGVKQLQDVATQLHDMLTKGVTPATDKDQTDKRARAKKHLEEQGEYETEGKEGEANIDAFLKANPNF